MLKGQGAMQRDMDVILISIIGKGRKKDGGKGYEKTVYTFPDGTLSSESAFFGRELLKYLKGKGLKVERWIVFGTSNSCWSEIGEIEFFNLEEEELYFKVFEEEDRDESGIDRATLEAWETCIKHFLELERLNFIMVDPLDYSAFINNLMQVIPEDKEYGIVFDMTHGFRHMSVLISFALMYLANFKKIQEIEVYYGAFELSSPWEPKPVLKLDLISELYNLSVAFNSYNSLGYFPGFLERIGIEGADDIYFKMEMNRNPRRELERLILNIDQKKEISPFYIAYPLQKIEEDLSSLAHLKYVDERMVKRAEFYLEKKQYLKSLILLYEALIILAGRFYKEPGDYLNYENRGRIRERLKEEIFGRTTALFLTQERHQELFRRLEYLRNASAHGSTPRTDQTYLESHVRFKELFKEVLNMYYELKKKVD